jgi:hypothetical protein
MDNAMPRAGMFPFVPQTDDVVAFLEAVYHTKVWRQERFIGQCGWAFGRLSIAATNHNALQVNIPDFVDEHPRVILSCMLQPDPKQRIDIDTVISYEYVLRMGRFCRARESILAHTLGCLWPAVALVLYKKQLVAVLREVYGCITAWETTSSTMPQVVRA